MIYLNNDHNQRTEIVFLLNNHKARLSTYRKQAFFYYFPTWCFYSIEHKPRVFGRQNVITCMPSGMVPLGWATSTLWARYRTFIISIPPPPPPLFRIIIQASRSSYTEEGGKIYCIYQSKKQAKKPSLRKADISLSIPLVLIKDCYAVRWYLFFTVAVV